MAPIAFAHWTDPDVVVGLLNGDQRLRASVGVQAVRREDRMLIIQVDRQKWDNVAPDQRAKLAAEWRGTWMHNMPHGIIAIVDATDDTPVVNYDGLGTPHMLPKADATPPPPTSH